MSLVWPLTSFWFYLVTDLARVLTDNEHQAAGQQSVFEGLAISDHYCYHGYYGYHGNRRAPSVDKNTLCVVSSTPLIDAAMFG